MLNEKKYCGRHINVPHSNFTPRSTHWDSLNLLKGLKREDISLSQEFLDKKRNFFFHATYTEYDAENFCRHLDTLDNDFSPEFKAFEKIWRRDELNHYKGFRYVYSIMFGESVDHVAKLIEERPYDFSKLSMFFADEFVICLLIAFDEILTAKGYASEHDLYQSFGNPIFLKWFKKVTKDEGFHFRNAMEVIRIRHFHRIAEIPILLDAFIQWDKQDNEYTGTFVLDHELYSRDFIERGAAIIKAYFI